MFRRNKFLKLGMGLVEENFVIAANEDVPVWESRGFEKIKKYPVFLYQPNSKESILLGKPLYLDQFGMEKLKDSRILDISTCCGTYGMGGPGFFGMKLEGRYGIRWLNYCVWSAGEYLLLNDRILECHPRYEQMYHPWIDEEHDAKELAGMLTDLHIRDIRLTDGTICICIGDAHSVPYELRSHKVSDLFPEKGGTGKKEPAFESGKMKDYWLVTYDQSILAV